MKFFYLSTKSNLIDKNEVHDRDCPKLPGIFDRDYLGPFNNEQEALRKAIILHPESQLCEVCCKKESTVIFVK
ncbi:hypothetical protein P872_08780 [Rhodonellum psychrophilum GCM71 = DSM 17998]|uniref:Uncharacterized protein n=2 Tax=Rhodonellum TaxID=336827 RepID=U5BW15_9BACT|nr:hypothetical protein [Rhodonellum psychrophilum]ERM82063.1 hypothetical protein P872_08780 [Rhodonellum psychrophilum GCM71 = DSM 17998]SDZ07817.1 hypothetical protein SAMN05444412_105196 [Rhodonellum ikkaensis]